MYKNRIVRINITLIYNTVDVEKNVNIYSKCENGQCIDLDKKCDNEINCFDKTDENCVQSSKN